MTTTGAKLVSGDTPADRTFKSVTYYQQNPTAIEQRLLELDKEWDIDQVWKAKISSLAVLGGTLGFLADRRFFAIPALAVGFVLQRALQGWCPPRALLRRFGFRTREEIDTERRALLVLRTRH